MEHIDPTKEMSQKHFCELFDQLPLKKEEQELVKLKYWPMYELFLKKGVDPTDAWLATKNTFVAMEPQIGKRLKK